MVTVGSGKQGSYRTYEEWKLFEKEEGKLTIQVLTVPMRNGNEVLLVNKPVECSVLTVPMRNGNFNY